MAGKTSTRVVFAAVLVCVGAYFAPEAVDKVDAFLGDAVGANNAVLVGEGETALLVAANAKAKVVNRAPETMVAQKSCDGLRVLVVDAARMPFIARNTKLAWESGLPAILTMNRAKQLANRDAACPRSFPRVHGGQCDEYPMASTEEGGMEVRAEEVPARENRCQGGSYVRQYPPDGRRFLVMISRPDLVATASFAGVDIAVEKDCG